MNNEVVIQPLSADEYNHLIKKIKSVYPDNEPIEKEEEGCSSLRMGLFGVENVKIKVVETNDFYDEI